MAMDLLVPAPMPDICVRLWKSCPRPASHVVPRLTDRLHRDRTAILMPSTVRSSGSPPFVSDFGKLPPYDRSPPSRRCGNLVAANPLQQHLYSDLHTASRSSFANHSSNICIATCTPLRVSWFANHPNRSRQIGRRRQCRRLVVTTSVVSAVSVVASVVSSVSVVVGTA